MSQLNTKRLFVAVELPKDIREYLGRAILGLQKTGADAKWVEPKNIHLTLKFLGATPPETIPAICKAMTTAAENTPPWPTTLESFGGFPSLTAPRVLWISLADKEKRLERLVQKLDDSFSGIGLTSWNAPLSP
jgi:2'-5' RNA ligase